MTKRIIRLEDGSICIKYAYDEDGGYRMLKIGGTPQESYGCDCQHCRNDWDCCGNIFCSSVRSYLFGFITIGQYNRNV